jgi:hypothetical protein
VIKPPCCSLDNARSGQNITRLEMRRGPSMYEMEGPRPACGARRADRSAARCCAACHRFQLPARSAGCPVLPASRGCPRLVAVRGGHAVLLPGGLPAQGLPGPDSMILWPCTRHRPVIPRSWQLSTQPSTCRSTGWAPRRPAPMLRRAITEAKPGHAARRYRRRRAAGRLDRQPGQPAPGHRGSPLSPQPVVDHLCAGL